MRTTSFACLIYGCLLFISGFMGFFDAGQTHALFPLFMSFLFMANLYFMMKRKKFSYPIALVLSLFLGVYFGYYFSKEQSFFPGIMAAFSAIIILAQLIHIYHLGGPE